jgi:hypothetical protein
MSLLFSEIFKMSCLKLILGAFKNPKFHREYLRKCSEQEYNIFTTCTPRYILYIYKITRSETCQKIIYSESTMLICLKLLLGAFRNLKFHMEYLQNYNEPTYKIFTVCTPIYILYLFKILGFEISFKKKPQKFQDDVKLISQFNVLSSIFHTLFLSMISFFIIFHNHSLRDMSIN